MHFTNKALKVEASIIRGAYIVDVVVDMCVMLQKSAFALIFQLKFVQFFSYL